MRDRRAHPCWVIYLAARGDLVKLGAANDAGQRLVALDAARASMPGAGALRLLATVPGPEVLERWLHTHLGSARVRGEWYRRTPAIEGLLAFATGWPRGAGVPPLRALATAAGFSLDDEIRTAGGRVRAARVALGYSQQALAGIVGRSLGQLQNLEADRAPLSRETAMRIADAVGCEPAWLRAGQGAEPVVFRAPPRGRNVVVEDSDPLKAHAGWRAFEPE